jgi:hypothetical protein
VAGSKAMSRAPRRRTHRGLLVDRFVENAGRIFTSHMLFPGASRTPIRNVQYSCTGTQIVSTLLVHAAVFAVARLCGPKPTCS